jgi:hypothetical protein
LTPGLAVLEASGLSVRAFARATGSSTDRQVIACAKPDTIAGWLSGLAAVGVHLVAHVSTEIHPGSAISRTVVERV